MLNIPQLDDLSYEKLFERARSRIPSLTEEWTDFNDHDPGITTLQTFGWLTDNLNYFMDATGEIHRLKYLKLLGITPSMSVAKSILSIQTDRDSIIIPKGAKFTADRRVFEACDSYIATVNQTNAIYTALDGVFRDITDIAGMDGSYGEVFSFEQGENVLYIGLDKKESGTIRLYMEIEDVPLRNAFKDGFSLCKIQWQYYNGSSWKNAKLITDETSGLLRSGAVVLKLEDSLELWGENIVEENYYIRGILTENNYDILPRLGKITLNCINVEQNHTISSGVEMVYSGGDSLPINWAIEDDSVITVSVDKGGYYQCWYKHSLDDNSLCEVVDGEYQWQKIVKFNKGITPNKGDKILVHIVSEMLYDQMILGVTDGTASQPVKLDITGVCKLQLALVDKREGRDCYTLWEESTTPDKATHDEKVFFYDGEHIVFGDAIHGLQPDPNLTIMAITIKTSDFEEGNVLTGKVNKSISCGLDHLKVSNISSAVGGKWYENSVELETKLEEKMESISRGVTIGDYQNIVKATPGLIIDYVNVIPMNQYRECYDIPYKGNTLFIAVKPHSSGEQGSLTPYQIKHIENNLEEYRLLTTNIQIIPPKYVKVNVFGRIDLIDETQENIDIVKDKLARLINYHSNGGFGKDIVYGKLFSAIEMLEQVRSVHRISFEVIGKGAMKNHRGDIVVHADALSYIGDIDIEFV